MSESINVCGAVTVKVDTGSTNALETLTTGGLRNGSEITFDGKYLDVHTDANGGDEGDPEDIQTLTETARIVLRLSRWDTAIEDKVHARTLGGTAGTVPATGTLLFAGGLSFRLVLLTTTRPLNFPRVVFREPREIGQGTKFSTLVLQGTAYMNASRVLWNRTTS